MSGIDHAVVHDVTVDDETGAMDTTLTPIPDFLTDRCRELRERKERLVAGTTPAEIDDLTPYVEVCHDNREHPTVACWAPVVDRDLGLKAYLLLVGAFAPDEAWFAVDAHMSLSDTNPATGEEWAHGEMQNACDNDGACDLGLITDCLVLTGIRKDGTEWTVTLPYHVHKADRTVRWVENEILVAVGDDITMDGTVPETMRHGWTLERPNNDEGLPASLLQAAVCRALHDGGYSIAAHPKLETAEDTTIWETILGPAAVVVVEP